MNFFKKILLDCGPFFGAIGTLCFGLRMTLSMSFKVRVDRSSPVLFCHLRAMIPRVISGCRDRRYEVHLGIQFKLTMFTPSESGCCKRYHMSLATRCGIEPYLAAICRDTACRLSLGVNTTIDDNVNQTCNMVVLTYMP